MVVRDRQGRAVGNLDRRAGSRYDGRFRIRRRRTWSARKLLDRIAPYMRPGNSVTPVPLTLPVAGLPAGSYLVEIRARDSRGAVSPVRTTELEVD